MQKTWDLGADGDFRWDKALAMADVMEDEAIIQQLSAGN